MLSHYRIFLYHAEVLRICLRKFQRTSHLERNIMNCLKNTNLSEKMLFFVYGGEVSMSADIANELSYRHPEIFVVVAYMKGAILNLSLRGAGVKKMLEKILPKLENATGGGHADAVGARIRTSDLEKFKELLSKEIT